jgi:hypothetical protein
MDVCLLCLYVVLPCVGRGLCDGLITRPEESYSVCVITETPKRGPMFQAGNERKENECNKDREYKNFTRFFKQSRFRELPHSYSKCPTFQKIDSVIRN